MLSNLLILLFQYLNVQKNVSNTLNAKKSNTSQGGKIHALCLNQVAHLQALHLIRSFKSDRMNLFLKEKDIYAHRLHHNIILEGKETFHCLSAKRNV